MIAGPTMKAISIRQPWAWSIVHGWKPVENRDWKVGGPNYREALALQGTRLLIHTGKLLDEEGYNDILDIFPDVPLPRPTALDLGGFVGVVDYVALVTSHPSKWFFGPLGLEVANAKPLPFKPWRGQLGFFNVPVGDLYPELVEGAEA